MRLDKMLGIKYPFIQGGMANIATGEFAAAVSNAGGLGLIGAGGMNTDMLRENIRKCRTLTDKPFGVNLMLMNPEADAMAELLVEENVKIVTTGAGSPAKYMEKWKSNEMMVIPVVSSAALAIRMERFGADAVVAEGTESGGHVGEMTTMTLVPKVVDSVNIPVIAAGGIADGRGMAAAFMLGAEAVQMGTRFVAAKESIVHANYKEKLIKSKDIDSEITGSSTGHPIRVIRNKMSREYLKMEKEGATLDELEQLTLGSLRKAVMDGDVVNGSLMAGQIAGMIQDELSCKEIITSIVSEAERLMNRK